ncbi:MAG: fumarylacetoacetate hydrolase family protein [Pseudomonadota bacterium]
MTIGVPDQQMSDLVIEAPPLVTLPVSGTDKRFPVRRIYCIGRNYAAHTVEMGGDPDREPPFFFQKNPNSLDTSGAFPYPPKSSDVHHEVEMAVALKSGGTTIAIGDALDHVFGYAVAIDMTRRDLQGEAKKASRPWEIGKSFERSAPCGALTAASETGHLDAGRIELKVNGDVRQEGDLGQMIWKVPEMIAHLSEYFELAPGDVILSGTPSGVGPVVKGDRMDAAIDRLGRISVEVV